MINVNVNAALVRGDRGKNDLLLTIRAEGAPLVTTWQLSPDSARNLADLLIRVADQAEALIELPGGGKCKPLP